MFVGSVKNNRKRQRLHASQAGRCFYCPNEIGVLLTDKHAPVLEHYIPRAAGGRRLVLACCTCDKAKGMIHGPEFEQIIRDVVVIYGIFNMLARSEVNRRCKSRNVILQRDHQPRIIGEVKVQARTERIKKQMGTVVLQSAVFFEDRGNEGRDQFIAQWEAGKPHTGDRHYQAWTGKSPA